jgi:hypothetical protein
MRRLAALMMCSLASAALAQPQGLDNAGLIESLSITDPAQALASAGDGWFAFGFPAIEDTRSPCCWGGNGDVRGAIGCSLDHDGQSYGTHFDSRLEETLVAYTQIVDGKVNALMVVGEHCPMDAGGQTIFWVPETDDEDTLDWLETLAREGNRNRNGHSALWAMALHASNRAGDHLHDLARENGGEMAEEAVFWLGEARRQQGYDLLEDLLDELPTGETRRHINFALSQNDSPGAANLLADIARKDRDPKQRGDALFWLAQEYPETAKTLILEVIGNETDRETLEKAVFAMSQLPAETAGPLLLELAGDSTAPREARRQALFWLAHSGDDRAVADLTEMLSR